MKYVFAKLNCQGFVKGKQFHKIRFQILSTVQHMLQTIYTVNIKKLKINKLIKLKIYIVNFLNYTEIFFY